MLFVIHVNIKRIYQFQNLSATNPGREGVKALAETLPHNRCLCNLRLEENRIEHTDAQYIAEIIKVNRNKRLSNSAGHISSLFLCVPF